MGEPTFEYKNPNHGANFNDVRENWCDVTIISNDTKYRAHKIVLAASLKYFKTRLLNPPEDSEQDIIDMSGINVTDLAAFISYAYTGKILLTIGNVSSLLVDAHRLNEDVIKEACVAFLRKHLKAQNAFLAYEIANTIGNMRLRAAAAATIIKNFELCSQTSDFLDFNYESLKWIFCVADSDYKPQQILFQGIMRWIMHNVKNRWMHTNELLRLIDLTKLTAEYLMNYLESIAHLNDLHGILKDLIICYHASKLLKQKRKTVLILQYFCSSTSNKKSGIQLYDLITKEWSQLHQGNLNFQPYVTVSDSAVLDDKLYYASGCVVDKLDGSTIRFQRIISSGNPLCKNSNYNLCACDQFLYLCGFHPNQLLRYDPRTFSFEELAPSELKKNTASAVLFYENGIHVLGGTDDRLPLRTAVKYDPVKNKWGEFSSMVEGRCNHAVAVLNGNLYACGGLGMNSVEVYKPSTKSWRLVASMHKKRYDFLVVAYEGKLFAIGGDGEKTVEVYDPKEDQWQMDKEASSGLQIEHPRGGLISDKWLEQQALKRPLEPTKKAPPKSSNPGDNSKEVQPPSKIIKK